MEETKYRVEGNTIHESLGFSLTQKSGMKKKEIIDGFMAYFVKNIIVRLNDRVEQGVYKFYFTSRSLFFKLYRYA